MLDVGAKTPNFTLTALDGATYHLGDALAGGPIVLVFFSAACGACHTALPYYNRLRSAYPGDGWQIWAISEDGSEMARWFAERFKLSFPILLDEPGWPVSKAYDLPSTPTFYLVEGDGRVAAANTAFSKDDLNELSRLLAQRLGAEPLVLAPADDGNPPFRPGCTPQYAG